MIRSNQNNIHRWFWNVLSSGLPIDYDLDILRKHILLNLIIILGSFFLGLLSIVCIVQDDYVLGIADCTILLFLLWLLYTLRTRNNHHFVMLLGAVVTGIFYLFLIAYGGVEKTAYLWAFSYPLITLFLTGKRYGTLLSGLLLLFSCIVFILASKFSFLQQYEINLIIRFLSVYLTIYIIGMVTEVVREKIQRRLRDSKSELQEAFRKVQESKRALAAGNQQLLSEIEERKQIEKALRNSEGFLDDIIESIQDGICVLNTDLTIRHTNSVMNQWYEHKSPLVGKKCYDCFHDAKHPCTACPIMRCMQSGKSERKVIQGIPGAAVEWIELSSFPIRDKDSGEITGAVEFVRNITTSKQLEQQLAHAQKMEAVGTLAAGVAHDLNNILSGIVSYPELLLMELPDDSPLKSPIQTIHKSGQKAAAIVQDLLTLARRGVSVNAVVNINDIISGFLESPECKKIIEFHDNVGFKVNLQPRVLNIVGSPIHLSKTIMNLVSNAAEAMGDGGQIELTTQNRYLDSQKDGYEKIPEGEYVVLSVTDSGTGIAHDHLHKIFVPFYTRKEMGRSGTGLGMAVVWGTVKDLNGFIDVQSSPGSGTRFDLYFPVTQLTRSEKNETVPVEAYKGNEKILIVDDLEEQRLIASAMLEKLGYSVAALSSGEKSISYLKEHNADIVILDMVMEPGMDGLETYREIVQLNPDQKAIIASGYSETERVKEAQKLGARGYVKKPYTLEEIGLSVRNGLDA